MTSPNLRSACHGRNAGAGLFDSIPSPAPVRRLVCHAGDPLLESTTFRQVCAARQYVSAAAAPADDTSHDSRSMHALGRHAYTRRGIVVVSLLSTGAIWQPIALTHRPSSCIKLRGAADSGDAGPNRCGLAGGGEGVGQRTAGHRGRHNA